MKTRKMREDLSHGGRNWKEVVKVGFTKLIVLLVIVLALMPYIISTPNGSWLNQNTPIYFWMLLITICFIGLWLSIKALNEKMEY